LVPFSYILKINICSDLTSSSFYSGYHRLSIF